MSRFTLRCLPYLLALVVGLGLALQVQAESLTRAPYLQMGAPDSMTVRWRTDTAYLSTVKYGTELDNLDQIAVQDPNDPISIDHSVRLTGLTARTRYYYAVMDSTETVLAGADSAHFFRTSPALDSQELTRVWVIGDSGTANESATAVRDAYRSRTGSIYTDLWIMLGDNAYNSGTDVEYKAAVFDIYTQLLPQSPLWATLGNHDGKSADSASQSGPYYDIFTLPDTAQVGGVPSYTEAYYSFDYGQIHFICLESYETNRDTNGAMLHWLAEDLEATTQPWIIAYWHHPPYTKGSHNSDSESRLVEMRENALPILESYGVDLVLSGHSHSYERSYLLDGHYGNSTSFNSAMKLDDGSGKADGDGAYAKLDETKEPHNGAVYIVAGSSGKVSGGSLNHPAMYASLNMLGSVILEVGGNELNATFIDETNTVQDYFTITKGEDTLAPTVTAVDAINDSSVAITYSEKVEKVSAEQKTNYLIDDEDFTVLTATLSADQRVVTLSTTTLTPASEYNMTISDVWDLHNNVIAVDTHAAFTFINLISIEFQDGVSPDSAYAGTRDAYLSELNADVNYGAGTTLLMDGDDGGGVDLSTVVQWDISAIPADAVVEFATLSFEVFNRSSSTYEVYALTQAWVENEVSWNNYADGALWSIPGAHGSGDRDTAVLATVSPGTGIYTTNFSAAGVAAIQAWVDGSSSNNGLLIADSSASDGVDMYSRESGNYLPKLTVVYSVPADPGDTEAPSIPGNLQATEVTPSSVALSWNASTDNVAVVGYKILRGDDSAGSVISNSYTDNELEESTAYVYTVVAYDAANNDSASSSPLYVTTEATISDIHVENIELSFEQVNSRKHRTLAHVSVVDQNGEPVGNASVGGNWSGLTTQSVSNLTEEDGTALFTSSNVKYKKVGEIVFTVSGVSAAGYRYEATANVESSNCIANDESLCSGGLGAPLNLSAAYDGSQLTLSWSAVVGADSYNVSRSLNSDSGHESIGLPLSNSFVDEVVVADTSYYYVVSALSGDEESAPSAEQAVTTTMAEPIAMLAQSVAVTFKPKRKKYNVFADIVVVDGSGNPVSGALLSGNWTVSSGSSIAAFITTDANGKVRHKLTKVSAPSGAVYTFTVLDIVRGNDYFGGGGMTSGSATIP